MVAKTKTTKAAKPTAAAAPVEVGHGETPPEGYEEQQAVEATPEGVQAQRAALKAAGYKRCPAHLTYLSRLPEAAQTPAAGYEDDVSVRPLSEFGSVASCK